MVKSYIYLLLLIVAIQSQNATQGTEGFYISPHGISRQREVHEALDKVVSKIGVQRTTYYSSGINYAADNFTLYFAYIDGRQNIEITGSDEVSVTGGKIQIQFNFNFSKNDGGRVTTGYAVGTVVSESFNYTKMLTFGHDGYLVWQLAPGSKSYTDLTIFNRMKIKRMEPYNQTDFNNLSDLLDKATSQITPSNVQHQILSKFNSLMPMTLNITLNSYILGPQINYSFEHPVKGKLNMTIIHHLYGFSITPEDGYKVIYLTEIKDWPQPICNGVNVPDKHLSFDFYGGSQNIHLICLYQQVVEYLQKKTWLDVKLDTSWDCNAFQFYAGDLYDLINNLYINVNPRELLQGQCKASPDRLVIRHGRDSRHNVLTLDVTYNCVVRTRNKQYKYIDVLNFAADTRINLNVRADKIWLDFSIQDAEVLHADFKPVDSFYVGNINLALFKINQILQRLKGQAVFGSGFPTLARELPSTQITDTYVIYSDSSHRAVRESLQTLEI